VNRNTTLAVVLGAVVVSAGVGWIAGRTIRSPAEVAATTRAPKASLITVPLERRRLTAEVVTRGTVGYGSPATVTLPASTLKQGNRIVTVAPQEGAVIAEGGVALAVSARPVVVLQGDKPMFRDLELGMSGDDVRQLEAALARLGQNAGAQDGVFDRSALDATAAVFNRTGYGGFPGAVPADEVLFVPRLPVRVGEVTVKPGDTPDGPAMTVTSSDVAVAASVSAEDVKLVREGAEARVEDPDKGLRATGTVTQVATTPGTNDVEPQSFYVGIVPRDAPPALVGSSVVVNITVSSTEGEVLAAPVAALSTSADGTTRLEVAGRDGTTRLVAVRPGLVARGMVEVTALGDTLNPGDQVVVGARPNR
jgi:hypothetical protein